MRRRNLLISIGLVGLAGCTEVLDDGTYLDERLQDGESAQFSADSGESLSIYVEDIDVSPSEEETVERTSVLLTISHDGTPQFSETVGSARRLAFEVEESGTHTVLLAGGSADVSIERE